MFDDIEGADEIELLIAERQDIDLAEQILNEDHYGLEKIKERILEFLAVRQLVKQPKGTILCFVGPPGVGKTSLGKSIAHANVRTCPSGHAERAEAVRCVGTNGIRREALQVRER